MKSEDIIYNDYICPYCKHKFNFRSGKLISTKDGNKINKNMVRCPVCNNGMKNKA